MKRFKQILACVGFVASLGAAANASASDTNATTDFPPGQGVRLNLRGAAIQDVLDRLSESAGFVIQLKPGVQLSGTVDVWSDQPLSKDEAVMLVKQVLAETGLSAVTNGRILTVMRSDDAIRNHTAVHLGSNPDAIPRTPDIVTQIMPVRNLNPVELAKVLRGLLPENRVPTVDESANALILTDTQNSIHRVAEIITALDSVSSSANTLRVFQLQYGDAKTLAGLIKELFTPPDTGARNPRGGGTFIRFPNANPAGGGTTGDSGQTPVSRVSAVADDRGNFVIVSAPEALLPAVEKLVASLDVSVEDVTQVQTFLLKNADPQEMAELLTGLFPDQSGNNDAGTPAFQFGGQGGRGGQAGGVRQGATASAIEAPPSGRLQKLGRVLAVPDQRTSTLVVIAARTLMPQIADLIQGLDEINSGRKGVHIIELKYADPYDVQQIIQELFPSENNYVNGSGIGDALANRRQNMLNNQFTSGPGSGASLGSGSSTGTRGNRGS